MEQVLPSAKSTYSPPAANLSEWSHRVSAAFAAAAIVAYAVSHLLLHRYGELASGALWVAIVTGGAPLLFGLIAQLRRGRFGADFLAGFSIVTAIAMREPLVAAIIILMLSGGLILESFATRRASSALGALAKRTPAIAHRVEANGLDDIGVDDIVLHDRLVIFPNELCPVDGTVVAGEGAMDESFLTGEPYQIRKTVGSPVVSGALNQDAALTIVADKLPTESRFARIMEVMRQSEEQPPEIRRLADRLGALYTPLALLVAIAGWLLSGQPQRFLAVLVIATPCPLLLAVPVAVIGAISLAAKRGIIIRKPAILEQMGSIRTIFFDKTGTLTHGEPSLTGILCMRGYSEEAVLSLCASLEQYSKHPLAGAVLRAAKQRAIPLLAAESVSEKPGMGLTGVIGGKTVQVTGRQKLPAAAVAELPEVSTGLECLLVLENAVIGIIRFHDEPRRDSGEFIRHLRPKHQVRRVMILSGDREREVQRLASLVGVGVQEAHARMSPEQKLERVRAETAAAPTLFVGDGINDAPAMLSATVGVAFGTSEVTAQAAGAVVMEPTLSRLDELLHIGMRMRRIALQSAVGGILLSLVGMIIAACGYLPPIAGALCQEIIDVLAVANALRASLPGGTLRDY